MKRESNEDIIHRRLRDRRPEELGILLQYIESLEEKQKMKVVLDAAQVKEMFNTKNDLFETFDNGYHCGSCRQSVYKSLVAAKTIITHIISNMLYE